MGCTGAAALVVPLLAAITFTQAPTICHELFDLGLATPDQLRYVNMLWTRFHQPSVQDQSTFIGPYTSPPLPSHLQPQTEAVERVHVGDMTRQRFVENHELLRVPVIITGGIDGWPAVENWRLSSLLANYTQVHVDNPIFINELEIDELEDDDHAIAGCYPSMPIFNTTQKLPLASYLQSYFGGLWHNSVVSQHSAIIDGAAIENYAKLKRDYQPPAVIEEGNMLHSLASAREMDHSDIRGAHTQKFWVIGAVGSGTTIHYDYMATAFWNACVHGRKRWVLIHPAEYSKLPKDKRSCWEKMPARQWFENEYSFLKESGIKFREFTQYAGEIVWAPPKTWHQVLNLEDSITATENVINEFNYRAVFWEEANEIPNRKEDMSGREEDEYQEALKHFLGLCRAVYRLNTAMFYRLSICKTVFDSHEQNWKGEGYSRSWSIPFRNWYDDIEVLGVDDDEEIWDKYGVPNLDQLGAGKDEDKGDFAFRTSK